MTVIRREQTNEPCPKCGAFLIEEEHEDIKEHVEVLVRVMKETEAILSRITQAAKTTHNDEEEQKKVEEIIPYHYREPQTISPTYWNWQGRKYTLTEWQGYFESAIKRDKEQIEYSIRNGRNGIVKRCEKGHFFSYQLK